jgi:hypothetical protein
LAEFLFCTEVVLNDSIKHWSSKNLLSRSDFEFVFKWSFNFIRNTCSFVFGTIILGWRVSKVQQQVLCLWMSLNFSCVLRFCQWLCVCESLSVSVCVCLCAFCVSSEIKSPWYKLELPLYFQSVFVTCLRRKHTEL